MDAPETESMNANQTTAAAAQSSNASPGDFSSLDANNFIRGNDAGCLIITNTSQAEPIETVFITVNRTYFRIDQFGRTQADRVARVERHTMASALETARQNGHETQLAAYAQSRIDISADIDFIRNNFELTSKDSKAGFGLDRDTLDEANDDHLEVASAPAGTSDVHGGGW